MDIELPNYSNDTFNFLGEIKYKKQNIPVYGGYGDLQASLLNISNNEWNINLGTGSQIAIKTNKNFQALKLELFLMEKS